MRNSLGRSLIGTKPTGRDVSAALRRTEYEFLRYFFPLDVRTTLSAPSLAALAKVS